MEDRQLSGPAQLFPSPSQRETDAGLRNDIEVTAMTLCYVAQTFRITAQPANLY